MAGHLLHAAGPFEAENKGIEPSFARGKVLPQDPPGDSERAADLSKS